MRQGIFFVVSAPSGTGKTTLCRLVQQRIENLHFTVSYTTRERRANEVDGREYHFVSRERFEEMIAAGDFAEHANVYGNWYGTSLSELEVQRRAGRDLLIEIDVQGARAIKERFPESVLIFIHPPSFEVLRERLEGRGTDQPEVIERRLRVAAEELALMSTYDYLIENQELETACGDFGAVIQAERLRVGHVLPAVRERFPGILS